VLGVQHVTSGACTCMSLLQRGSAGMAQVYIQAAQVGKVQGGPGVQMLPCKASLDRGALRLGGA